MEELDINKLSKGKSKNIKIGELSSDVINALGLDLKPQNINIWSTRIQEHCENIRVNIQLLIHIIKL